MSHPLISGERSVRDFLRADWTRDRRVGSHVILVKPGHPAAPSIPLNRELAPGTLRAMIRAAGISVQRFVDFL